MRARGGATTYLVYWLSDLIRGGCRSYTVPVTVAVTLVLARALEPSAGKTATSSAPTPTTTY